MNPKIQKGNEIIVTSVNYIHKFAHQGFENNLQQYIHG